MQKTPHFPPGPPLHPPVGSVTPSLTLGDICRRFSRTRCPPRDAAGPGCLFGSCSLGLSFISSIVFTSASRSASSPAAGSPVLNHRSARRLPGAGFMPPSTSPLDGYPKNVRKPPPAFFFYFFLLFFLFYLILLNLPALPHCFPLLPFGRGVILALEACSDTWLLAARGFGSRRLRAALR